MSQKLHLPTVRVGCCLLAIEIGYNMSTTPLHDSAVNGRAVKSSVWAFGLSGVWPGFLAKFKIETTEIQRAVRVLVSDEPVP